MLCLLSASLFAQQGRSEAVLIKGRVVAAHDTTAGVAFSHIYNKNSERGATSDAEGHFRLLAAAGDSVEFRMVGYVDTTLSFQQIKALHHKIPLRERVYKLRQVDVRANRLKTPFAPAEPSKDPYVGYKSVKPSGRPRQQDEMSFGPTEGGVGITGGVTALANLFNDKEKQRIKIRELKEQARQKEYYKALFEFWFDKEIVSEITGLKGAELNRFLKFCNPSLAFLEEATEYQIITAIQKYHRRYLNVNRY